MDKTALIESGKALMRTVLFALMAWLMSEGVIGGLVELLGTGLDSATKLQIAGFITFVLAYVDKAIHNSDSKMNGLLPKTDIT